MRGSACRYTLPAVWISVYWLLLVKYRMSLYRTLVHISVVPADEAGSGQTARHILHAGIKLFIADGLEKIVQGADIISLEYILLICGQKYDLSLIALLPHPAGNLNAAAAAELDIQKNEIKAGLFFCEKVFSGGKERNRQNCRVLILPFAQHFFEQ